MTEDYRWAALLKKVKKIKQYQFSGRTAKLGILAASVVSAAAGLLMLLWVTAKSPNASSAAGRC